MARTSDIRNTDNAEPAMTMDRMRRGDEMVITDVGDERARVTAIRFGIAEGATVTCVTKIPAGPIVLKSGRQEIAVGRNLAKRICVGPCPLKACPGEDVCPEVGACPEADARPGETR